MRPRYNRLTVLAACLAVGSLALALILAIRAAMWMGRTDDRGLSFRIWLPTVETGTRLHEQLRRLTEILPDNGESPFDRTTDNIPPFVRIGYVFSLDGRLLEARRRKTTASYLPTQNQVEEWRRKVRSLASATEWDLGVIWDDGLDTLLVISEENLYVLIALMDSRELRRWLLDPEAVLQIMGLVPAGRRADHAVDLRFAYVPLLDRARAKARRQPEAVVLAAGSIGFLVVSIGCTFIAVRQASKDFRLASTRAAFVAGITHDLKTPLTAIRLLAETLRGGRVGPEAVPEVLDTVVRETERLQQLVENALASLRIENGAHAYQPRTVLLQDAVRRAARRVDYVPRARGFTVKESYTAEPLVVRVDLDALQQAVLNLVSNAAKYSGTSREIALTVDRYGENARISVEDSGLGIHPREHSRIFEPFYRSAVSSGRTTGAGLGLAVVRHFATAHGGRVELVSAPGEGSRFDLILPLASSDSLTDG